MMKRLYLEQQHIPITDLTEEQQANLRTTWPHRYFVTRVIGSTIPKVRSHLTEEQVKNYCRDDEWHVEIV